VLLAYLQQELVERLHWLTAAQLLDAVAIGQLTPGPVLTTATFIGYLLAGNWGAVVATVGMFLPSFGLVGLIHPWVPRLRRWAWFGDALAGVNAAAWGLMAAVVGSLAPAALVDGPTVGWALMAGLLLERYALNAAWLVLAGGLGGWLLQGG
jgi:chromate transporter